MSRKRMFIYRPNLGTSNAGFQEPTNGCRTIAANLSNAYPEPKQKIGKGLETHRNNKKGLKKQKTLYLSID